MGTDCAGDDGDELAVEDVNEDDDFPAKQRIYSSLGDNLYIGL